MFRKFILFILVLFVFIGVSEKPIEMVGKWYGVLESNSNKWLRFDSDGKCFANRGDTIETGNWNASDDSLYFYINTKLSPSVPVLQEFSGYYKIIEDTLKLRVKINMTSKDFIFIVNEEYHDIPMIKRK